MLGNHRWGILLPLILMLALAVGLGCRKELPELFDRNAAPETYITAAPVESLFDGFQVHMHWSGRDTDGLVSYFLWAWTDSSRAYYSAWNPETRADDRILRDGVWDATHQTTKTDSVFSILANDGGGTARDVTFNITAVDDQGKRDPLPARLYFFGSVDRRPEIIWLETPPDTLGAGEPFQCRFTGGTQNGYVLGYQWSFGDDLLFEPRNLNGDPIWTHQVLSPPDVAAEDANVAPEYYGLQNLTELTLEFNNDISGSEAFMMDYYKYGTFLIKARCQDLAGVASEVNTEALKGVLAPILNKDPDTRLRPWNGASDYPVVVRYKEELNGPFIEYGVNAIPVDTLSNGSPAPPGFHYAIADTLPWGEETWVRFFWQGWDTDDPVVAKDLDDPDFVPGLHDTIRTLFQTRYSWRTLSLLNEYPLSGNSPRLFPEGGRLGIAEELGFEPPRYGEAGTSFEMNVATPANYVVKGYSKDYFDRLDGTEATVSFTGGFISLVDSIVLTTTGSARRLNLTELPPGDPVRIDLEHKFSVPAGDLFAWDADTRTVTIKPDLLEGFYPDLFNEFSIMFAVYGHDDPRNGMEAQLGRIRWDLDDDDFSNSSFQFVNDVYWVEDGSAVKWWKLVDEENTDPPAAGSYTVQLKIRNRFVFTELETPVWLGPKAFSAQFCNTIGAQTVENFIEDVSQSVNNLSNIGRVSLPLGVPIDIQFKSYSPGP